MARRLVLFGKNGDSIAESPGALWDLLASAGEQGDALDPDRMTVAEIDAGTPLRVMTVNEAIAQKADEQQRQELVAGLRRKAAGYTKLAKWIEGLGATNGGVTGPTGPTGPTSPTGPTA